MRDISVTSLAEIAMKTGTEPINILAIQWVDGGSLDQYADRDLAGGIKGKIKFLSELDAVINVSGGGQSQAIEVTLDDTDGSIKAILDANDIHKRPCYIYQWFEGLDLTEKFLIFQGQVSSPITWNESGRQVSFTVISKLEDREVGFSAEDGAFEAIPEEIVGQPWPMIFGTALHVPALAISKPRVGTITSGAAIRDFTIPLQIDVLALQRANTLSIALIFRNNAEHAEETGDLAAKTDFLNRKAQAETRAGELLFQAGQLQDALDEQILQETSTLTILGGEDFPQGTSITLDINGGLFTGYFSGVNGTTFHITDRQHPEFGNIETPFIEVLFVTKSPSTGPLELVGYSEEVTGDSAGFFFAQAGSRVKLAGAEPIDHVVSIVPGEIISVHAYRAFEGVRRLVTVPPNYYTTRTQSFGSISAEMVRLVKPLSNYEDEGWDDDIYVTFESDVGPNVVDILEYLIEQYTPELTVDATSFNYVKTRQEEYPANFALLERKNVVQVLEEIARQARCAIWLTGDTFYLRYLSEEPSPTVSIAESDVVPKTMEVFHTNTEDLVTKYVAEWREHYAVAEPNKVILKHNVKKYGTQELVEDYYIYNTQELVIKSATFWLIRMANTWKKIRFSTYLTKLQLETLDSVDLDFTNTYVANESVVGIIEQANYDSDNNQIAFEIWTPVKAGTMVAYDFAFPADIDQTLIFPTIEEEFAGNAGGDGPGKDADGDLGSGTIVTITGYRANQSYGDKNPSDTGDVAPPLPPIVTTGVFDVTNPNLTSPVFQKNASYNPGASATGGSVIDIHTTIINDSLTNKQAKLDTFFKEIGTDLKLHMDTNAVIDDGTNEGTFDFFYDSVNSPNKWAAGRAKLLDV